VRRAAVRRGESDVVRDDVDHFAFSADLLDTDRRGVHMRSI
jgi:hypothetical protein